MTLEDQFAEIEAYENRKDLIRDLLRFCGEDPRRPGLQETPERFIKALRFYMSGYGEDPAAVLKVFDDGAEGVDQMVVQRNIRVWSTCEHHLAPFFGVAHVAYLPNKKIVGLSKLARVVKIYMRRLQVQERLTNQVADLLWKELKPLGVGVVLKCRHACMEGRGVQEPESHTLTTALRGAMLDDPSAKAEFLALTRE